MKSTTNNISDILSNDILWNVNPSQLKIHADKNLILCFDLIIANSMKSEIQR